MHTMVQCRSSGSSSKESRNAGKTIVAKQRDCSHHATRSRGESRKEPNYHLDESDSDECESVGSNPTPPPEYHSPSQRLPKHGPTPKFSQGHDHENPSPPASQRLLKPSPNPKTSQNFHNDSPNAETSQNFHIDNPNPKIPAIQRNATNAKNITSARPKLEDWQNTKDTQQKHFISRSHPPTPPVPTPPHPAGTKSARSKNASSASSSAGSSLPPQDQPNDPNNPIILDEGDGGGVPSTRPRRHSNSYLSDNNEGQSQFYGQENSYPRHSSHRRHPERNSYRRRSGSGSCSSGGSQRSSRSGSCRSSGSRHSSNRRHSRRGSRSGSRVSDRSGMSAVSVNTPYPAKWRTFGRRPPAILEFRPLGEGRVKNVRPAGKSSFTARLSDAKGGDKWDFPFGMAKPITDCWTEPLNYGYSVVRIGDIDPFVCPSRGDVVVINPAQNFYRAMKSGYVMTYRGRDYSFGIGDLIIRVGRFMPSGKYIPYGNLEMYMYTQTKECRLLGRQPFLLVDFNYHNLDYESPGKHLAIGTFLNEILYPRRGDIIIRGGAWAENFPNIHRKHHSSVKYWKPTMEFRPNDMLLRPYVDIGRCQPSGAFYWGAIELYTYSGKGLAWAYWGRDHHICDTPFPREQEHGIKTGHYKDEVGHYADCPTQHARHRHHAADNCHDQHDKSHHINRYSSS